MGVPRVNDTTSLLKGHIRKGSTRSTGSTAVAAPSHHAQKQRGKAESHWQNTQRLHYRFSSYLEIHERTGHDMPGLPVDRAVLNPVGTRLDKTHGPLDHHLLPRLQDGLSYRLVGAPVFQVHRLLLPRIHLYQTDPGHNTVCRLSAGVADHTVEFELVSHLWRRRIGLIGHEGDIQGIGCPGVARAKKRQAHKQADRSSFHEWPLHIYILRTLRM